MEATYIQILGEKLDFNQAFSKLKHKDAQQAVLNELGKRLIYQHYFKEFEIIPNGMDINPENLLKEFCARANLSTHEMFNNYLHQTRQTKEELLERIVYQEQLIRLKSRVITEHDINNAFIEQKSNRDSVIFSIIRVEKQTLAKELYYRLKDDHIDFGEIAREFSVGTEAKDNGVLGPVPLQNLNPELRNRIISLKEGDITYPFTMDDKLYLIVRLIRLDSLSLTPQLENSLRNDLFEQWLNRQLNLVQIYSSKSDQEFKSELDKLL